MTGYRQDSGSPLTNVTIVVNSFMNIQQIICQRCCYSFLRNGDDDDDHVATNSISTSKKESLIRETHRIYRMLESFNLGGLEVLEKKIFVQFSSLFFIPIIVMIAIPALLSHLTYSHIAQSSLRFPPSPPPLPAFPNIVRVICYARY